MSRIIKEAICTLYRYPIDVRDGTVHYRLEVNNITEQEGTVACNTFCAGWLMIGKEKELDAHALRELKFQLRDYAGMSVPL